jgi:hypothetical protein
MLKELFSSSAALKVIWVDSRKTWMPFLAFMFSLNCFGGGLGIAILSFLVEPG